MLYLWNLSAPATPTTSTPRPCRPARSRGRPGCSARSTPATRSPSTNPRPSLWVMTLSARIFGFNSWSLLVPQALMGVGSVALLHAAVRRWAGPVAGLLAGAALALTPAAVLMFRFDNPDALLVLLLVAGGVRDGAGDRRRPSAPRPGGWSRPVRPSASDSSRRWARPCWSCRRSGWPTWSPAPPRLRTRLVQLLAGARLDDRLGRLVHRAGRAVACRLAALHRRLDDNSLLELALGYNGLGRILGGSGNGGGGCGGGEQPASAARPASSAVHRRAGPRDLLAAARRADRAGRAGRRRRAPRAATARVRQRCCGAAGRW